MVPGKAEMFGALPRTHRERIFDRPVGLDPVDEPLDRKAQRHQRGLDRVEHGAGGGGDARRGDQRLGELDGVDGMGHAAPLLLRGAPSRGFASRALYAKQRKNKLPKTAMPKLDLDTSPQTNKNSYPEPYDEIGRAHV